MNYEDKWNELKEWLEEQNSWDVPTGCVLDLMEEKEKELIDYQIKQKYNINEEK